MAKKEIGRASTGHLPPFGLRMQPDLHERVKQASIAAGRSMNAEIVARLQQSFAPQHLRASASDTAQTSDSADASRIDKVADRLEWVTETLGEILGMPQSEREIERRFNAERYEAFAKKLVERANLAPKAEPASPAPTPARRSRRQPSGARKAKP